MVIIERIMMIIMIAFICRVIVTTIPYLLDIRLHGNDEGLDVDLSFALGVRARRRRVGAARGRA